MTVHLSCCGSAHSEYVPATTAWLLTLTSVDTRIVVQLSAPGHHTRPYGTSAPNSDRPRATGRLYSIVIVVPATCWLTEPCWLGFGACAQPGAIQANTASAVVMTTTDAAVFIESSSSQRSR